MTVGFVKRVILFIFVFDFLAKTKCQDYFDEIEDEVMSKILQVVKLRKCNCGTDEIWNRGICEPAPYTSVPVLLFHDILEPILVNTSYFDVLERSGINCQAGKYVARLEPSNDFFILSSGELYHLSSNSSYSTFEFCIEHVLTSDNELTWEVQTCLPSLEISVCCQESQINKGYCQNPFVPIGFGRSYFKDVVIKSVNKEKSKCNDSDMEMAVRISEPQNVTTAVFLSLSYDNVQLVYSGNEFTYSSLYYNKDEFCLQPKITDKEINYEAVFCTANPLVEYKDECEEKTCVRKCCPENALYSFFERGCFYSNESLWHPRFYRENDSLEVESPSDLKMSFGFPICKRSFHPLDNNDGKNMYFLLNTGELLVDQWENSVPPPRYCIDNFQTMSGEIQELVLTCFPDNDPSKSVCDNFKKTTLPFLLVISCLFLLITLIVYVWIPELHAKLHGKSLLSHVTALFIAYLFLALVQWTTKKLPMIACRIFGFLIQISFLASFFWLNVMCFDIWWTLRSMRPVAETSESSRRRFVYYSIYAWGCPLIIGIATLSLEFLPKGPEYNDLILPGFGQTSCWFVDNISLWIYFYNFVSILTALNILFFIFVAIILIRAQRANNGILRTTNKQHKERVWLYLKLFVVMGVTWICEVVSWQEGSCEYWIIFDIINALQGVFIFLIFICKKNILFKVQTRSSDSTRKLRRMVTGSSSYGSSSQVTQQSSLDSSRKLSSSLHYHLSKLNRMYSVDGENANKK